MYNCIIYDLNYLTYGMTVVHYFTFLQPNYTAGKINIRIIALS